ncbi:MAG: SDR family NAD(P)-dependent oxidoreductase [Thermoanaerobaculia bacterium]
MEQEAVRSALVTGGTRGIGYAVARRLSREGFTVTISGTSAGSVEAALKRFRKENLEVAGRPADARKEEEQEALVRFAAEQAGRLDVLVNNAGIGETERVDRMDPETFRAIIETNLYGPFYALRAAAPIMLEHGGGFVINIASLAAVNPIPGGAAYNASKFGLLGFSEASMLDLRHEGIRVAAILPGSVATEMQGDLGRGGPGDWMLSPDDVAEAVIALLRFPDRALPSRVDLRPSRPPKR